MKCEARYESDDRDDDERGVLEIFTGGNGDWYATVGYADQNTALEKGVGFPPAVRFCTSGTMLPHAALLCICILGDIGRGNLDEALWRAEMLLKALAPGEHGRDLEHNWSEVAGK